MLTDLLLERLPESIACRDGLVGLVTVLRVTLVARGHCRTECRLGRDVSASAQLSPIASKGLGFRPRLAERCTNASRRQAQPIRTRALARVAVRSSAMRRRRESIDCLGMRSHMRAPMSAM